MSDNLRRYCAIQLALKQLYPSEPSGNLARHLSTLAALGGFYLCHSHLGDPARLCRLLMATCLAYYWMVCLGAEVVQRGWQNIIHRGERCELSLFQLGLTWLKHCLNENWPVPVRLQARSCK